MPPKGKKQQGSLGRAVIKSRFQGQRSIKLDEGKLHTTDSEEPKWVKMQSITQENDLEAFLTTAALAGTEFTAEKLNVKVVQDTYQNPFLLSEQEEEDTIAKHRANYSRLTVPRRPPWDKSMSAEQLHQRERESFLDWRRGMAQLEEDEGLLLTPYEKNLEVWRQLWRVIERSQLVVQIVDARNPLLFRSADLEKSVKEVDPRKKNLLLINKADYLSDDQRRWWADYFESQGIRYTFFSAALAAKQQEEERLAQEKKEMEEALKAQKQSSEEDDEQEESDDDTDTPAQEQKEKEDDTQHINEALSETKISESKEPVDERIRVRTTTNLLDLLIDETPKVDGDEEPKVVIGLVGYPNVGKSSTINALIGEKRVSVSSTPGKTKHFQTIHLTPKLVLCDCPGLVFPTFSTTKADQVCNGVLPIDQLREHSGPTSLVAKRIPQAVLEATYGIRIRTQPKEDGGSGIPTSAELCSAYAIARGYFRSSQGNPDEARAARYILKDYVNGKLLYCHPPPNYKLDSLEFNKENNQSAMHTQKKLAPVTRVPATAANYVAPAGQATPTSAPRGSKTEAVDRSFFHAHMSAPSVRGKAAGMMRGGGFSRVTMYPHQRALADDGTPLPQGRRERLAMVAQNAEAAGMLPGKKHHKKGKKHVKVRSGAGYGDYD
ncbi:P-loop containing nucleoside triphosphate hydrolase protein [Lichtheimia hyalospora FSU 10163]|nr:P-loop containing nucleoside triphosphate hydrolase protein [Lichtheimia hyalospora FSU 10163]